MPSLTSAVDDLLVLLRSPVTMQQLQQAVREVVLASRQQVEPEEINAALRRLVPYIKGRPFLFAAWIAQCSGALIEVGGDPHIPGPAILRFTQFIMEQAAAFAQACREEERKEQQADEKPAAIDECIGIYGERVAERMPEAAQAWEALPTIERAANAVLMREADARAAVRNHARFMAALEACSQEGTLSCLRALVRLLEREELIVLHPALKRGYCVRINGIGDNFQLHTLLADALIGDPAQGWLPGKRPDPRVAAAAKDGPFPMPGEESGDFPVAVGAFNLWNWQGLRPDGSLPSGLDGKEHWIWNEGVPADIAPFEGQRVVLLSPPPYARTWNAGRFFPAMKGELEVLEILTPAQVEDWLSRIAAAPR